MFGVVAGAHAKKQKEKQDVDSDGSSKSSGLEALSKGATLYSFVWCSAGGITRSPLPKLNLFLPPLHHHTEPSM